MTVLHKSQNRDQKFEPKEGQRGLLCSNKDLSRCPSLSEKEYIFSQETINSLIELGDVLKPIRRRLFAEGYTIVNGKLVKPTPQKI